MGIAPKPPNARTVLDNLEKKKYKNRRIAKGQVTRALKGVTKIGSKYMLTNELERHYPRHEPVVRDAMKERDAAHKEIAEVSKQMEEEVAGQMDYDTLLAHYKHEHALAEASKSTIHDMRNELTDVKRILSALLPGTGHNTAPAMARAVVDRMRAMQTEERVGKQDVVIYVTGPSSSGKSTLIQLLEDVLSYHHISYTMAGTGSEHLAEVGTQQHRLRAVARKTHVTLVERPTNNDHGFCEATRRAMRVPGVGW
jgi:hypothetical protein